MMNCTIAISILLIYYFYLQLMILVATLFFLSYPDQAVSDHELDIVLGHWKIALFVDENIGAIRWIPVFE